MSKREILSQGRHHPGRRRRSDEPDLIAVERACYGDPLPLSVAERRIAVERCRSSLRLSTMETARLLGLNSRAVTRIRSSNGGFAA